MSVARIRKIFEGYNGKLTALNGEYELRKFLIEKFQRRGWSREKIIREL